MTSTPRDPLLAWKIVGPLLALAGVAVWVVGARIPEEPNSGRGPMTVGVLKQGCSAPLASGTPRLVFLGSSILAAGVGTSQEIEAWLERRTGRPVDVVRASEGGFVLLPEIAAQMTTILLEARPRMVVIEASILWMPPVAPASSPPTRTARWLRALPKEWMRRSKPAAERRRAEVEEGEVDELGTRRGRPERTPGDRMFAARVFELREVARESPSFSAGATLVKQLLSSGIPVMLMEVPISRLVRAQSGGAIDSRRALVDELARESGLIRFEEPFPDELFTDYRHANERGRELFRPMLLDPIATRLDPSSR